MNSFINKNILITRALKQQTQLTTAIKQLGGHCITLPCLTITTLTPVNYKNHYDICITTSTNAAHEFKTTANCWIAIGPATATALEEKGIHSIIPDRYNSEGILALHETQSIFGKNIAIFTGIHPKPLLHNTLQQRGAHVDLIYCYKRNCPHYSNTQITAILNESIDCIIVSSGETLTNLCTIFNKNLDWLIHQPILVISESMYEQAKEIGFITIYQANDPSTDSICRALLAIGK